MPRVISFIVLLAIVLLVGAVFFQVMAQFIVPLFLACVLLVVFQPLHRWTLRHFPTYPRVAALITTAFILLAVLLPLVTLGWNAYVELHSLFAPDSGVGIAVSDNSEAANKNTKDTAKVGVAKNATSTEKADVAKHVSGTEKVVPATEEVAFKEKVNKLAFQLRDDIRRLTNVSISDDQVRGYVETGQKFLTVKAISGLQSTIRILVGLAIMVIALYYFLADGPVMIDTVMDLSPLDARYEQELLARFGDVSRAVVVATLLSAVVQGTLAGVGYACALSADAPIFLLTALTMATALVPFVGAAAVWICVCGWVYLYGEHMVNGNIVQGDPTTAIILAIYCTIVVSGIDNVIKPYILHGQSKLHPLLALLSILGGVQVLGPVGILVGPMLVSFLQALLNMLRKELDSFSGPVVDGSVPLAASMAEAFQTVVDENGGETAKMSAEPGSTIAAAKAPLTARSRRSKRKG